MMSLILVATALSLIIAARAMMFEIDYPASPLDWTPVLYLLPLAFLLCYLIFQWLWGLSNIPNRCAAIAVLDKSSADPLTHGECLAALRFALMIGSLIIAAIVAVASSWILGNFFLTLHKRKGH